MVSATASESTVVLVAGQPVSDAIFLSMGKKASSGILLVDENRAVYITSNATDIADLITKMVSIVAQLSTIATGLDNVSNSPGSQAVNIGQLNTLKTELDDMKDKLK